MFSTLFGKKKPEITAEEKAIQDLEKSVRILFEQVIILCPDPKEKARRRTCFEKDLKLRAMFRDVYLDSLKSLNNELVTYLKNKAEVNKEKALTLIKEINAINRGKTSEKLKEEKETSKVNQLYFQVIQTIDNGNPDFAPLLALVKEQQDEKQKLLDARKQYFDGLCHFNQRDQLENEIEELKKHFSESIKQFREKLEQLALADGKSVEEIYYSSSPFYEKCRAINSKTRKSYDNFKQIWDENTTKVRTLVNLSYAVKWLSEIMDERYQLLDDMSKAVDLNTTKDAAAQQEVSAQPEEKDAASCSPRPFR